MADNQTPQSEVLDSLESNTPESLHPILEAAFKYRKQLIIAVCVIVGAAAIYAGYTGYHASAMASSQSDLGKILVMQPSPEKAAKLEALVDKAHSSVKPSVIAETAKASMEAGDYAKSVTYFDMLIDETEGEMQFVAHLGKAKALLLDDKAEASVSELEGLADSMAEAYAVPFNRQLALSAEAAGDKAKALAAYKVLAEKNVQDMPFVQDKISELETN